VHRVAGGENAETSEVRDVRGATVGRDCELVWSAANGQLRDCLAGGWIDQRRGGVGLVEDDERLRLRRRSKG